MRSPTKWPSVQFTFAQLMSCCKRHPFRERAPFVLRGFPKSSAIAVLDFLPAACISNGVRVLRGRLLATEALPVREVQTSRCQAKAVELLAHGLRRLPSDSRTE